MADDRVRITVTDEEKPRAPPYGAKRLSDQLVRLCVVQPSVRTRVHPTNSFACASSSLRSARLDGPHASTQELIAECLSRANADAKAKAKAQVHASIRPTRSPVHRPGLRSVRASIRPARSLGRRPMFGLSVVCLLFDHDRSHELSIYTKPVQT